MKSSNQVSVTKRFFKVLCLTLLCLIATVTFMFATKTTVDAEERSIVSEHVVKAIITETLD